MSKMQKTLTMNRRGNFEVFTVGDSHCGTLHNDYLPVQYHLNCVCENVLDSRGFLFEQVSVDNFFKNIKKTRLSCEKLTISCVRRLITLIKKDNPICRIQSIELTLSPFPHAASMTYAIRPKSF
jgi:hypothetical protein